MVEKNGVPAILGKTRKMLEFVESRPARDRGQKKTGEKAGVLGRFASPRSPTPTTNSGPAPGDTGPASGNHLGSGMTRDALGAPTAARMALPGEGGRSNSLTP